MKVSIVKSILIMAVLIGIQSYCCAQDEYAGVTDSYDGEEPGPFTKYGWIIIVVGLIVGYIKNQGNTKKL